MAEKQRLKVGRWVALGTVLGVVAAWGGFGIVGAVTSAPSSITTCTSVKTGKTKVTSVCKAGKGIARTWVDSRYVNFLRNADGNYSGLDLSGGISVQGNFFNSNFTNVNFTGADLFNGVMNNSDFGGANFTNADLTGMVFDNGNFNGATWSNTTCPDGTNSNVDNNSCHLHGAS